MIVFIVRVMRAHTSNPKGEVELWRDQEAGAKEPRGASGSCQI